MSKATVVIGANTSGLARGLDEARGQLRKFGEGVKGSFAGTFSGVGGEIVGLLGVRELADKGKATVNLAADLGALEDGFKAMAGEGGNAEEQLRKVKELAKLPGLGFKEALQGATNLKAVGFNLTETEGILREFGNSLAIVGKGKAELEGVVTALSQMAAKNKVSAEEINQIAERVPQIRKAMQGAFGTAETEELQKMGISVQEFVRKVVAELGKGARAATGLKNELENIGDESEKISGQIGKSLAPTYVQLLKFIQGCQKFGLALKDVAVEGTNLNFALKETFGHHDKLQNVSNGWQEAKSKAEEYRKELEQQIETQRRLRSTAVAEKMVELEKLKDAMASSGGDETKRARLSEKVLTAEGALGNKSPYEILKNPGEHTKEEIKLAAELLKLREELMQLETRIHEEKKKADRDTGDRLKKEKEIHGERAMSLKELIDEIRLLELRAKGKDREAAAMEKQLKLAAEAKRIKEEMGLTEEQAMAVAQRKMELEEKAAKRQEGRDGRQRIQGFKQADADPKWRNSFRNLDEMKRDTVPFFEKHQRTPLLDEAARNNKRDFFRRDKPMEGMGRRNEQRQAAEQRRGNERPDNMQGDMVTHLAGILQEMKTLTGGL